MIKCSITITQINFSSKQFTSQQLQGKKCAGRSIVAGVSSRHKRRNSRQTMYSLNRVV